MFCNVNGLAGGQSMSKSPVRVKILTCLYLLLYIYEGNFISCEIIILLIKIKRTSYSV